MKYILLYFVMLNSLTLFASEVVSITESYSAFGINPADEKKLADICSQLKTDHLQDIELLHQLHSEFKELVSHQDTMLDSESRAQLSSEIKKVTERVIAASNPAWNKESIPFKIIWNLPRELFFDETEYKAISQRLAEYADLIKNQDEIKGLIHQVNPQLPTNLIFFRNPKIKSSDFIKNASNPNEFSDIHVIESYYVNKPNADIQKYFYLPWYKGDRSGLDLTFEKQVTALEFCQFLPKTKFLIKVDYIFEALGLSFNANKNFFLEIKMENL